MAAGTGRDPVSPAGTIVQELGPCGGPQRDFDCTRRDRQRTLLTLERDVVPLHGDIDHGHILDFGPRGWLAIDPKRLIGTDLRLRQPVLQP